jgi:UDP-glucose 4-epimerase
MRVLVTGGAGYVGSASVRLLLDAGHEVVVIDTLERGWREAVDARARLVVGDVGDTAAVTEAGAGCDAVLHLAGYIAVGEGEREPARFEDGNVTRPSRMLEVLERSGVRDVVFFSSAAVYGEPTEVPITEDAPTKPVSVYGRTKLEFEQRLESWARVGAGRCVSLRYFNVAGAWPNGSLGEAHEPETHIIPRVLRSIAAGELSFEVFGDDYPTPDGTCIRDYVHVLDLARAHLLALEMLQRGGSGGAFNLGNGRGYSNLEVMRTCAAVTGVDVGAVIGPRRPGDSAVLVASHDLAERALGWRAERGDLATMVSDAWTWHRSHPAGYRSG